MIGHALLVSESASSLNGLGTRRYTIVGGPHQTGVEALWSVRRPNGSQAFVYFAPPPGRSLLSAAREPVRREV